MFRERFVEILYYVFPLDPARSDLVELLFHFRSKLYIDDFRKIFNQHVVDQETNLGWRQPFFIIPLDIVPALDSRDNRRVCRWPPDSIFFQYFNEACFCIPRRRLSRLSRAGTMSSGMIKKG